MEGNFAHIIKEDFSLGLIYLKAPRCIKWFGAGFEDDFYQWMDKPTIGKFSEIIVLLDMKELDLQRTAGREIPLITFEEYAKKNSK